MLLARFCPFYNWPSLYCCLLFFATSLPFFSRPFLVFYSLVFAIFCLFCGTLFFALLIATSLLIIEYSVLLILLRPLYIFLLPLFRSFSRCSSLNPAFLEMNLPLGSSLPTYSKSLCLSLCFTIKTS